MEDGSGQGREIKEIGGGKYVFTAESSSFFPTTLRQRLFPSCDDDEDLVTWKPFLVLLSVPFVLVSGMRASKVIIPRRAFIV
jgi:hypothetical protein